MLLKKKVLLFVTILVCTCFLSNFVYSAETLKATDISYKPIDISTLSRYTEERIAFQHIQLPGSISYIKDNAISSLMIIKNNQVYLFRDGYDDPKKVAEQGYLQDIRRLLPKDLWVNKLNSKPDYLRIADRRTEKLLNVTEEFVEKNFGEFYRNVRNSFVQKHVQVFKNLMKDRIESSMHIVRKPISPPSTQEIKEAALFSTIISAKAMDETVYYAEDMDGDNVTETFYVTLEDGFNWGYKSGPNIVFIYNNQEDDVKQLIGKLCYEAYYGTKDEEKMILKTFPKDSDIIEEFRLEKVTLQAIQSSEKQSAPSTPATQTK